MGTISTSTGLVSGLDIESLITKLMEVESASLKQVQTRVEEANTQKMAYQTISAQLLSALSSISRLSESSAFSVRSATSSKPDLLTATAEANAPLGSYSFLVRSIVSTHQMASLGVADRNSTPVGAGTLTFDTAQARVDPDTELSALNGGAGIRRGQIRIVDRNGDMATIDLRSAYSMADVLEAINSQTDAAVRAYVENDRLVVEDMTGLPASEGKLTVTNVGTGYAATDLGIVGVESGTGRITSSSDLIRLTGQTSLSSLNDRLGVRFNSTGADFSVSLSNGREFNIDLTSMFGMNTSLAELNGGQGVGAGTIKVTNRAGESRELELKGTETVSDLNAMLAGMNLSFGTTGSGGLTLTDNSTKTESNAGTWTGSLKVEDVTGTIAAQLKLAGEAKGGDTGAVSISGVANYQFTTIDSIIRKVQYARDGNGEVNNGDFEIAISSDGKGLTLIDNTAGMGTTSLTAAEGSSVLADLGLAGEAVGGTITGDRLISGINTVLLRNLNGGSGVRLGTAEFQTRDGTTLNVDFTGAQTLQDVVNRINETGSLKAEVSAGGTGISITDLTLGTDTFTATGDTLDDLHVSGSSATGQLSGGDLNRRYISEGTLLSTLNGGKGIGLTEGSSSSIVKFQITNSAGQSAIVSLSGNLHKTIGDVIGAINTAMQEKGVQARINSAGDGIELFEDTPAGTGRLSVTEVGSGTTAAALRIKGEGSATTPGQVTGSFGGKVEIGPTDTLEEVMNKINAAGLDVRASIINDGSGSRPYRLLLTSNISGTAGRISFTGSGTGLSFETLTEAEDARVVMGDINSTSSIVVSSSSNQVTGLIPGVTLNLTAPSDQAIQVSVGQNVDSIVNDLNSFITAYNGTLDRIDELTKYDAESQTKGVLLGDSSVVQIQDRLYREISQTLSSDYKYRRLTDVGITYGSGGRLELNEEKFRAAVSADPEAVKQLFTKVTTTKAADGTEKAEFVGIAAKLKQEIKDLTSSTSGLLGLQTSRIDDRIELYNERIKGMQILLDKKEARYYAQFQAMETALSKLQSQQSALTSLAQLASSSSSSA